MDAIERAHIESLLQTHRNHLYVLEQQEATLGIMAPPHVITQIGEYRKKIAELVAQLRTGLPRHNLPPREYERFVGRQKELAEVCRILQPYPKSRYHLVTIDGIGGIGKSALALEIAYTFRDEYAKLPEDERFEAIVWVSAKHSYLTADGILERRQAFHTLDDLYTAIAHVLDYPAIIRAPAEEQPALVDGILRERRTLLILDNLETINDEDELLTFLRELPDPAKAIVTTRDRIDMARPIRLIGMSHTDAHLLMDQEATRKMVNINSDEKNSLWLRTGGVPLAIVWSIGLMGLGNSIENVLRRLSDGQSDIAKFCFEESVAHIHGRDAYKLLLALSLFDAPVNKSILGHVSGLGEDDFGRDTGLGELVKLSLVIKEGNEYDLMPLTRNFVEGERIKQGQLEQELQNRWLAHLSEYSSPYTGLYWRWRDRYRLHRDGVHLIKLADWCQHISRLDILLRIAPALIYYYDLKGNWNELINIGTIAVEHARLIGDFESIIFIDQWLAWVWSHQGRHNDAVDCMTDARNAAKQLGDVVWHCSALQGLSQVLRRHQKYDQAFNHCQEAIELAKTIPDEPRLIYVQADIEYELGKLARDREDFNAAKEHFITAREVFRTDDDKPVFNIQLAWGLLCNLGYVAHMTGDLQFAAQTYSQCLDLYQDGVGKGDMTTLLVRLASLEELQGHAKIAEQHAREALDWASRLGMKNEQAHAKALLAKIAK